MAGRRLVAAAIGAITAVVTAIPAGAELADDRDGCDWSQWGYDAAHDGQTCAEGGRGLRLLAHFRLDPFAEVISGEFGGVPTHYPVPLVDSDGTVLVLEKSGEYVACDPPWSGQPAPCDGDPANIARQVWSLKALRWRDGSLVPAWTFTSDFKPVPLGWESMFQAATAGRSVYVPGAGGTAYQLDKRDGRVVRRINPFGVDVDPAIRVSGGLTVGAGGALYYNAIAVDPAAGSDARSWLVRIGPDGGTTTVDYATLNPAAPDLCYATFAQASPRPARPWPPPPQADGSPTLPPRFPCLSQRAATNVTPAIGADGTIFTVARAHSQLAQGYAYLLALRPDLSLKWATSLRDHLADGCGVLVPYGTGTRDCRAGSTLGVDPATNLPPAGEASDWGSSSPAALPDGGVLYAAYSAYNGGRGHLMKFDRTGQFVASHDFGWDYTPAVVGHGDTYSVVIKDNDYDHEGPFDLVKLDADLNVIWRHTNTSTETCQREPDGTVTCVDTGEHPNGFEWCVNAPAVDRNGTVYAINEDGYLYVVDSHGRVRERAFLSRTTASAYTPVSIDDQGRVYAQNNGELYVLGR